MSHQGDGDTAATPSRDTVWHHLDAGLLPGPWASGLGPSLGGQRLSWRMDQAPLSPAWLGLTVLAVAKSVGSLAKPDWTCSDTGGNFWYSRAEIGLCQVVGTNTHLV